MTITVYSKPACVQCTATTRALDRKGIDYTLVDISADAGLARSAAAIWLRISASSGLTMTVGPAPAPRSSRVATK
ncbi:MAG: hypothetical protein COB97_08245 [Paracoccus sp.]|nr:MAG: hypothetical protein COB97_08245 [Paracoccus sp. (in: a-proteobacteria)]